MAQSGITLKKQWFIQSKTDKPIEDIYYFDRKKALGTGSYGSVVKAELKGSSIKRAIKIIQKKSVKNQQRFKAEIDIMTKLDHPNVIKLYETFEDTRNIYLVMELCEGGELFDRIIEKGFFSEEEARDIFFQIMSALNYCHSNKIAHRDLKPENFLLLNKKPDSPIKIIDFGLSTMFDQAAIAAKGQKGTKLNMQTRAGTPYYISPEVLQGDYDESCDIWSAGVILYILLSGVPPFYGDTDKEIMDSVKLGKFDFDLPEFDQVSEPAKDLIRKMICKPKQRLAAAQVLNHNWLKEKKQMTQLKLNLNTLKKFQSTNKLKKATLTYIASQLDSSEIQQLQQLFLSLDTNNDGVLSVDEIRQGLKGKGSYKEIEDILLSIDTDGSGKIDYNEFIAATLEKQIYLKEEKLFLAFKMFDLDGNGKISAMELETVLGKDDQFKNLPKDYWKNLINDADIDGDGEIDYNEFIEMMRKEII